MGDVCGNTRTKRNKYKQAALYVSLAMGLRKNASTYTLALCDFNTDLKPEQCLHTKQRFEACIVRNER